MSNNDVFKKVGALLLLLLWAGGIVFAVILAIVNKALVPILGVAVLIAFGIPSAKKILGYLQE